MVYLMLFSSSGISDSRRQRTDHRQSLCAEDQRQRLEANVLDQRPADHSNLRNPKLLQDLDGRLCLARHLVGVFELGSVAELAVPRKVERQCPACGRRLSAE